jgi:hypothetical protein
MSGDASAYAALGLEPGATPAAVERAYKRLIKLHHPDREGGDAQRAAEINRAYRDLRTEFEPRDTLVLHEEDELVELSGKPWVRTAVVLLVALGVLLLATGPVGGYIRQLVPSSEPSDSGANVAPLAARDGDPMDEPLHLSAINGVVRQALRLGRNQGAMQSASRECHRVLRTDPSVIQLDRCAAFDDAVVQLQNRDPMWDQGPFSELSVTGRQWSGASSLSNDYLAIDSRLDRIRVQVELALAPPAPPPPVNMAPALNAADELLNGTEAGNQD